MRERTIEAPVNPQQQSKTSRQSQTTLSLNHVIDWDRAKMNDRESNRMDRWIRKAIHIRKKQDKSMNWDKKSYQLSHVYDYLLFAAATPGGQLFRRRQQRLPKRRQNFN